MHACMQLTPSDTVVVMAQVPDEGLATLDEAPASLSRAESDPTSLAFVPAAPVTPIDMYDEAPCHTLRCHTALSGTYVSRDGVVEVRMKHIMCYLRLWSESMQQSFALQLHAACVIDSHRRPLKRVLGPHLPEPRKSFYAPSRSSAQISWRQSAPKLRTALKRCTHLSTGHPTDAAAPTAAAAHAAAAANAVTVHFSDHGALSSSWHDGMPALRARHRTDDAIRSNICTGRARAASQHYGARCQWPDLVL
jgi:hypothetical protein